MSDYDYAFWREQEDQRRRLAEIEVREFGALSGLWTPAFQGATTAGSFTYSTQTGRYTRWGNTVRASCRLIIATIPGAPAGGMRLTGLPFTVVNAVAAGDCFLGLISNFNYAAGAIELTALAIANQVYVEFYEAFDNAPTVAAPATSFPVGANISLTCIYEAA